MGVGLHLAGKYGGGKLLSRPVPVEQWLEQAAEWFQENAGDGLLYATTGQNFEGKPTLFVRLHPCAEDLEIFGEGRGRIIASGKTSITGPGYHLFVCELLKRLGSQLGVQWVQSGEESGDETGYFHTGDKQAVYSGMLNWLRTMGRLLTEQKDMDNIQVNMAMDYSYDWPAPILTPLGPRSLDWAQAVADDPKRGIDLFPWWEEGQGAGYCLGRALALLWVDVRWRKPLSEAEEGVQSEAAELLAAAYEMDPKREYPWREWQELLNCLDEPGPMLGEVARRAEHAPDGPKLGYRRRSVTARIAGGWSIKYPGSFAEEWEEEGGTWVAWDDQRTIRFTSFTRQVEDGEAVLSSQAVLDDSEMEETEEGERYEHEQDHLLGRATIRFVDEPDEEEDDEPYWMLQGRSALPGKLGLTTICFASEQDRDWALETWKSVSHSEASGASEANRDE